MRVGEMPLDFGQAGGKRPRRQRRDIGCDEIDEIALLLRRQRRRAQTFIGHDAVVLKRAAEMQIVGEVTTARRQVAADHGVRDDRLALLARRQRAHQRQAGALFVLEQMRAGERPGIGVVRLGAEEAWASAPSAGR